MTGLPRGAGPFSVLGLPARADLTDDDVRSAWRRIAAASHPDRADGGDPGRFAAAAAAYTTLRTRSGRGEAMADLASPPPGRRPAAPASRGTARPVPAGPAAPPPRGRWARHGCCHGSGVAGRPAWPSGC